MGVVQVVYKQLNSFVSFMLLAEDNQYHIYQ